MGRNGGSGTGGEVQDSFLFFDRKAEIDQYSTYPPPNKRKEVFFNPKLLLHTTVCGRF